MSVLNCVNLIRHLAFACTMVFFAGCASTGGGGGGGAVYVGADYYDPWYWGPGYVPPPGYIGPPPSRPVDRPPHPSQPIARPPSRPAPMPRPVAAPRPAMRR